MLSKYQEIPPKKLKQIIYPTTKIETPFGQKQVIYADFIASGRPSPIIEKYIADHVYGKYSNTHSNASNGICMKNEIEKVKQIIKAEYGVDDSYEILFKGSGVTGVINYLIDCLDYSKFKKVHVFISIYEHYSNHLPWVELAKKNKHITLHIIPLVGAANELDVKWYESQMRVITGGTSSRATRRARRRPTTLIITSIIHCSNLTGYFTPLTKIKTIMDKCGGGGAAITKYLFSDMACSAPYSHINGRIFDAFFISPHKFIGGMETPGVLVAKTCLFHKDNSTEPGGSCIKHTHYNTIEYSDDIEIRENAGTPNIIGIIKIGQCIQLKQQLASLIKHNEHILSHILQKKIQYFTQQYSSFFCITAGAAAAGREAPPLPIFSFHLSNLHYNFIVVLLNDLYGIQSRGGISCDGLFNDFVKEKYGGKKTGFCRISFHWSMTRKNILYILDAVEYIITHGEQYLDLYGYDKQHNLWACKGGA